MLDVAREREVEGDLILGDLGEGLPFRAGAFDGAISISALQVGLGFNVTYLTWLLFKKVNGSPSKRVNLIAT